MPRLYGSLQNRLMENSRYTGKIEVGTLATELCYSDRHPYEVTRVIDQNHVFIRALGHKSIGDCPYTSESQKYEYFSKPEDPEIELAFTRGKWRTVRRYNKQYCEDFNNGKLLCYWSELSDKEFDDLLSGKRKEVKKTSPFSIAFGFAEEYYDPTF